MESLKTPGNGGIATISDIGNENYKGTEVPNNNASLQVSGFTYGTDFNTFKHGSTLDMTHGNSEVRVNITSTGTGRQVTDDEKEHVTHSEVVESQGEQDLDREAFSEFIGNTTFHGIRYIFEGGQLMKRK